MQIDREAYVLPDSSRNGPTRPSQDVEVYSLDQIIALQKVLENGIPKSRISEVSSSDGPERDETRNNFYSHRATLFERWYAHAVRMLRHAFHGAGSIDSRHRRSEKAALYAPSAH